MATIDSKDIIDEIIASNGYYMGDPRVYQIVEYENYYGRTTWGVSWSHESRYQKHRYEKESAYVCNPRVIWKAE